MNGKITTNILDHVITTVSEQEFNRLASGLTINEKTEKVRDALESLGKLQKGEMSNYHDEWVALFYHWYQPAHINLAYSMIKSIINSTEKEKLYIVDFGCGSLAMQFGVALAVADTINKKSIAEIRIDSIDTSQAMIDIGKKMWEEFTRYKCFHPACEIITPEYHNDIRKVELAQSGDYWISDHWISDCWISDCWISAIHPVYDENKDDIKQSLKSLRDILDPDVCFVSTHHSKKSLLSEVWPFVNDPLINDLHPQFNGELTKITQWRQKLNSRLSSPHPFLNFSVKWKYNAAIRCFYPYKYRPHSIW